MSNLQHTFVVFGALLGLVSIAAGAFGAHLLKTKLPGEMLQAFEIAARYQMYNAITLILLAALMGVFHSLWFAFAGGLLIFGAIIFSGSLYLVSLSGVTFWGAFTPVGGVLMILGWLCILFGGVFGSAIRMSS